MVMEAGCEGLARLREWAESSSTGEVPHRLGPTEVAVQGWGTPNTKHLSSEPREYHHVPGHGSVCPARWGEVWVERSFLQNVQGRNKTRSGRVRRLSALFMGSLWVNKYCFALQKLLPRLGCGGRWLLVLGWWVCSRDAGRELQPWVALTLKQVSWEGYPVNPSSAGSQMCAVLGLAWQWTRLVEEQLCALHPVRREIGSQDGRENRAVTILGHVEWATTHLHDGGKQGRLMPWGGAGCNSPAWYIVNPHLNQRCLCSCWLARGLAGARRALRCQPYSAVRLIVP